MKKTQPKKRKWWEDTFDQKYLDTYIDSVTKESTDIEIKFLSKILKPIEGKKILDLACGYGRHSIALSQLGAEVTGIDQSKYFIDIAEREAKKNGLRITFLNQDIKELNYENTFDAVLNLFSSFGYFEKESDNRLVVKKVAKSLVDGGLFVLDLKNRERKISKMKEEGLINHEKGIIQKESESILSNGIKLNTTEKIDLQSMRWKMLREWEQDGVPKSYKTDLRLYSLPEIRLILEENGFKIQEVFGEFDGSPFSPTSTRMIILARRK